MTQRPVLFGMSVWPEHRGAPWIEVFVKEVSVTHAF